MKIVGSAEVYFRAVAIALVVLTAGVLYAKGCARGSKDFHEAVAKQTVKDQTASIEISNKTIERVTTEQEKIQDVSDKAAQTIRAGRPTGAPPVCPGLPAGQLPPVDRGDLAGDANVDACDHDCIMRLAWEAKNSAARAACQLRGTDSCDQPAGPTK